jgi:hypothetical protein
LHCAPDNEVSDVDTTAAPNQVRENRKSVLDRA